MRKSLLTVIVALMGCALLTGCNKEAGTKPSADENVREEQQEKEEPKKKKKKSDNDKKKKRSLAQRMVGKYSFDLPDDNPENDEYLIMNVITFGDNLYAYCGQAMYEEGEITEAYSYWAAELIPYDPDIMKSTSDDTVRVNALCFSNMSNAGQYWNKGWTGDITVTDEGLLFEGFDEDSYLCDQDGERLFKKDDSIEDVFAYIDKNGKEDKDLQGLWISDTGSSHAFLCIEGSNMTVYKKPYDAEVIFGKLGCDFDKGSFTGSGNLLGLGKMPYEISADYSVDGDKLTMNIEGDRIADEFFGKTLFLRASEEDIPVITMDDINLDDRVFDETDETVSSFESGEYYGVFVASFKTTDECLDTEMKLDDAGYRLCPIVYTPDFSELNPEPYYVVTAGMYSSKKDAEDTLADVKAAGFKDAYVKFAGTYTGNRSWYWLYGGEQIEIQKDRVILHDVSVTIPYMVAGEPSQMNLIIDDNTVFDSSAEMQFFGNYEKGETPYDWITKNHKLMIEDPDKYNESGPALSGIFEVELDENRVIRYYGSYWWD